MPTLTNEYKTGFSHSYCNNTNCVWHTDAYCVKWFDYKCFSIRFLLKLEALSIQCFCFSSSLYRATSDSQHLSLSATLILNILFSVIGKCRYLHRMLRFCNSRYFVRSINTALFVASEKIDHDDMKLICVLNWVFIISEEEKWNLKSHFSFTMKPKW